MTMSASTPVPVVAVVGEVVADAVLPAEGIGDGTARLTVHPGGGPANTALALARLGSTARFAGRLSTGTLGRLCRDRLVASGVDLSCAVDVLEPATLAIATLSQAGAASYEFYVSGTADWGWTDDELARLLRPELPVVVHSGSLALALQPSGDAIERLLARARPTMTTSIDPNLRTLLIPADSYRAVIDRWAGLADIVRLSSDDLDQLWPGVTMTDAAARLHGRGVVLVVVTLGGDGVFAARRAAAGDSEVRVPPVPVALVDTVGAGDSFQAGLLHHLAAAGQLGGRLDRLDHAGLAAALEFASAVAAITCCRPGADPPWATELGRLP
jgi:fructokinase